MLGIGITSARAQEAVVATGGDASGTGGSASYSAGQVVYTSASGGTGTSNQGVQQPFEFFGIGISENNDITLSMSVFPNPAESIVNLHVENLKSENLSFQLYDATGKLLTLQKISLALTTLPMQKYAAGQYLLTVSDQEKILRSFTIIKNN